MVKRIDWAQAAKLLVLAMIVLLAVLMLRPLLGMTDSYSEREINIARAAVDKALVQCFAMEGSYPSDIGYLVDNYGLILDQRRYLYVLDNSLQGQYMENYKPQVIIIPLQEAVEP